MKEEVVQYNQSRRQGSIHMLLVVPRQIHHTVISLQDFKPTVSLLLYWCNPIRTILVMFVSIPSVQIIFGLIKSKFLNKNLKY